MTSIEQKITDTIEDLKSKSRQIFEEKLVRYEKEMREHLLKREVDSKGHIVTPFFNFQFKVENTYTVAPATCSCSICSAKKEPASSTGTSSAPAITKPSGVEAAPTIRRSGRLAGKPKPDYKVVEEEEKKAVISEREIEEKLIHVEPPASLHDLRKIFIDATTKTYIEKGGWTEENIVQMESKRADYYAALQIYQDRLNAVSSVPLSKGWVKEIERWHRIRIASKVQTQAAPRRSSRLAAKPKPDYKEVEEDDEQESKEKSKEKMQVVKEKKQPLKVSAKEAAHKRELEIEEKLIHVEPPASLLYLSNMLKEELKKRTLLKKENRTQKDNDSFLSLRQDYLAALQQYRERLNAVSSFPVSVGLLYTLVRRHCEASKVQATVAPATDVQMQSSRQTAIQATKPKPDYKKVEQQRRKREIEEKLIHVEIPASLHYIEKVYMDAAKGLLKNKTQEYKESFKLIKADYFNVMRQYQERLQAVASFPVIYGTVHQLVKRHREANKV